MALLKQVPVESILTCPPAEKELSSFTHILSDKESSPGSLTIHSFIHSFFLGPLPQHMKIPRLGVKSDPQLLTYTTATATPDLS